MKIKPILWTLVFLLLISNALALGLSPAEKTIDYVIGERTFTYKIINNEHKNTQLKIYAIGQLNDYITFEQNNITIGPSEETKEFSFTINLPPGLIPGKNIGKIVIEETILQKTSETGVYAKLRIISKLIVNVPYPDKYIKVVIEINDTPKDQPVDIVTKITNLGKLDIDKVEAKFGIFDNKTKIEELETKTESLAKGKTKNLLTSLNTSSYKEGFYSAIATIVYDQQELELGRDFKVGEEYIDILDYTKYFIQGKVNKFDIDVENKWNRKIRNAFALIYIEGFEAIKSMTYDLDPWQIKTIVSYWDTSDIDLGTYDSNVTLKYINKTSAKQGKVHVVEESELKHLLGGTNYAVYIIIGIILLILINLYWIRIFKRKLKNE